MKGLTYEYTVKGTYRSAGGNTILTGGSFHFLDSALSPVVATVGLTPSIPVDGQPYESTLTFVFPGYGPGYRTLMFEGGGISRSLSMVTFLDVAEKIAEEDELTEIASEEKITRAFIRAKSGFCGDLLYDDLSDELKILFDDAFFVYLSDGGNGLVETVSSQGDIKTIRSPYGQEFSYYQTTSVASQIVPESPLDTFNRLVCEIIKSSGGEVSSTVLKIFYADENTRDAIILPGESARRTSDVEGDWPESWT